MQFKTIQLEDILLYEKGVEGREVQRVYGDHASLVYDFMKTSDLTIFDKNKDYIKQVFADHKKNPNKHNELFFYRLKKLIYLAKEFKDNTGVWKSPLVVRSIRSYKPYSISTGVDRLHIMKNFNVKEYECLILSNIEFSQDFEPKLKTLWPEGTEFDFKYKESNKRYKFQIKNKIVESELYNLKLWLEAPWKEGQPSAILVQPNRVSFRDAAMARLKKKG